MGQPFASIQQELYDGLQRPERPFRQRLFPISRQGRGQRDENADREDRIWRQAMKILVSCRGRFPAQEKYVRMGRRWSNPGRISDEQCSGK